MPQTGNNQGVFGVKVKQSITREEELCPWVLDLMQYKLQPIFNYVSLYKMAVNTALLDATAILVDGFWASYLLWFPVILSF